MKQVFFLKKCFVKYARWKCSFCTMRQSLSLHYFFYFYFLLTIAIRGEKIYSDIWIEMRSVLFQLFKLFWTNVIVILFKRKNTFCLRKKNKIKNIFPKILCQFIFSYNVSVKTLEIFLLFLRLSFQIVLIKNLILLTD